MYLWKYLRFYYNAIKCLLGKWKRTTLYLFIVCLIDWFVNVAWSYFFQQLYRLRLRPSPRLLKPRRLCWRVSTARGRRRSGPPQPSAGPRPCVWGGSLSTLGRALHAETSETLLYFMISKIKSAFVTCVELWFTNVKSTLEIRYFPFRMQMMGIAIKAWNDMITIF